MTCNDVIKVLEVLAPPSFAEKWDNVGLLVGRGDKQVKKVMIALDATENVIDQAIAMNVDMLITHHPLLFSAIKRITEEDFIGRRLLKLCKFDICYYAMHTNFDVMGMADAAADEMRLKEIEVLEVTYEDDISKEGIGRVGVLSREMSLRECAEVCKKSFGLENVRVFGEPDKIIDRVAISPGSGKDFIDRAIVKQADVLITGDIGHHAGIDAMEQGLAIIDAGHYGLEKIFIPYMVDAFARELPEIKVLCAREQSPFYVV